MTSLGLLSAVILAATPTSHPLIWGVATDKAGANALLEDARNLTQYGFFDFANGFPRVTPAKTVGLGVGFAVDLGSCDERDSSQVVALAQAIRPEAQLAKKSSSAKSCPTLKQRLELLKTLTVPQPEGSFTAIIYATNSEEGASTSGMLRAYAPSRRAISTEFFGGSSGGTACVDAFAAPDGIRTTSCMNWGGCISAKSTTLHRFANDRLRSLYGLTKDVDTIALPERTVPMSGGNCSSATPAPLLWGNAANQADAEKQIAAARNVAGPFLEFAPGFPRMVHSEREDGSYDIELGVCGQSFSRAYHLLTALKIDATDTRTADADAGSCPKEKRVFVEKAGSGRAPYLTALLTEGADGGTVSVRAFDDSWKQIAALQLEANGAHLRGEDESVAVETTTVDGGIARIRRVRLQGSKLVVEAATDGGVP